MGECRAARKTARTACRALQGGQRHRAWHPPADGPLSCGRDAPPAIRHARFPLSADGPERQRRFDFMH
ncbi:hypothetical protein DESPIGER_2094 [Desulfovibrio piger]|uniref:Uncharacterized protein n=1 Tax=Desulfovibrio piger TaxID=901 RepID=A0A1K1LGS1_9BACT|nr:hypothetical protein DESPIGER_2094 [Desulfovibrio piger]